MACQGFGTFGALAVQGPGVPDRGEMEEEEEEEKKEKEEEKWADLKLKSPHLERWGHSFRKLPEHKNT